MKMWPTSVSSTAKSESQNNLVTFLKMCKNVCRHTTAARIHLLVIIVTGLITLPCGNFATTFACLLDFRVQTLAFRAVAVLRLCKDLFWTGCAMSLVYVRIFVQGSLAIPAATGRQTCYTSSSSLCCKISFCSHWHNETHSHRRVFKVSAAVTAVPTTAAYVVNVVAIAIAFPNMYPTFSAAFHHFACGDKM